MSTTEDWRSAREHWYWGVNDLDSAMEEVSGSVPDLIRDEIATRVLIDRIGYALNGAFLSFQDAIGQPDGGVASLFASGWETVIAARIAIDILAADQQGFTAWDGKRMPADWDGSPSFELRKVSSAKDLSETDVRAVVDAFADRIAKDAGVKNDVIDRITRDDLVEWFTDYLKHEASFETEEGPSP